MGLFSSGGSQKQHKKSRSFSDITGAAAEKYVDSYGDLGSAWAEMQANPAGLQGSYWIQRMGGEWSKKAFGEAHRGEDTLLHEGKYLGGTEVKKETDAYKAYFPTGGEDKTPQKRAIVNPDATSSETSSTETSTTSSATSTSTAGATTETTTQTNAAITAISDQITALQDQLTTASAVIARSALGIPYDAPSHIKTYEQYRAWLSEQSSTSGFTSTVTTSMSGTADYLANVKKQFLTALNALGT